MSVFQRGLLYISRDGICFPTCFTSLTSLCSQWGQINSFLRKKKSASVAMGCIAAEITHTNYIHTHTKQTESDSQNILLAQTGQLVSMQIAFFTKFHISQATQ